MTYEELTFTVTSVFYAHLATHQFTRWHAQRNFEHAQKYLATCASVLAKMFIPTRLHVCARLQCQWKGYPILSRTRYFTIYYDGSTPFYYTTWIKGRDVLLEWGKHERQELARESWFVKGRKLQRCYGIDKSGAARHQSTSIRAARQRTRRKCCKWTYQTHPGTLKTRWRCYYWEKSKSGLLSSYIEF